MLEKKISHTAESSILPLAGQPQDARSEASTAKFGQVGPKYGITDYERKLQQSFIQAEDQDQKKITRLRQDILLLQKQRLNACDIADYIEKNSHHTRVTSWDSGTERRQYRSLGKPAEEVHYNIIIPAEIMRMKPDDGTRPDLTEASFIKGLVRDRDDKVFIHAIHRYDVTQKKCEEQFMLSGMQFHRHALERFYEREKVETGKIGDALKRWLPQYTDAMAFAFATMMFTRMPPVLEYVNYAPGMNVPRPVTAIPCGDGLMIVEITPMIFRSIAFNHSISKNRIRARSECFYPMIQTGIASGFSQMNGALAITYLSNELLREEQEKWREAFLEEMKHHDVEEMRKTIFGMREPHKPCAIVRVQENDRISWLRHKLNEFVHEKNQKHTSWSFLII